MQRRAGEERRKREREREEGKKLGHSNLDASSKAICSDGERGREEEENKELKSISAKEGMA